jgi:thioredoxin reductase
MTAHEALWLIKTQLQKNDQNIEAVKVLEDIVKSIYRVHIDDYGTEAQHMLNHMAKVAKQDIHELHEREKYHANWVDDNGHIRYKEVLDAEE